MSSNNNSVVPGEMSRLPRIHVVCLLQMERSLGIWNRV